MSTQKVRQDIQEYIERVRRGGSFDDVPVIISFEEHSLICTAKNRLTMVQFNHKLEKNAHMLYEKLVKSFQTNTGVFQAPRKHIGDVIIYGDKTVASIRGNVNFTSVVSSLNKLEQEMEKSYAKRDKKIVKKTD